MPSSVKATVDGIPVPLFGPISWVVPSGVTAPQISWALDPASAARVLQKREVTIRVEGPGSPPLEVKRAVVISEGPSSSKYTRTVLFSNVLWYAQFKSVVRSFNVRARTGNRRRAAGVNDARSTPERAFRLYSLTGGQAWKTSELIKHLMDYVFGPGKWRQGAAPKSETVPNNVELFDRGDMAIARALAIAGNLEIRPELDGTVTLYARQLGDEAAMVQRSVYDLKNLGKLRWISLENVRPQGYVISVVPECEVRTDVIESDSPVTQSNRDAPFSEWVLPIGETGLQVDNREAQVGEHVEYTKWLSAVQAKADYRTPPGPFTRARLLRGLVSSKTTQLLYAGGLSVIPSQVWGKRVRDACGNYRRTARLNPRFVARCVPGSIQAVLAAADDVEAGTQVQSPVFVDYCVKPSVRQRVKDREATQAWNFDSFPWQGSAKQDGEKTYTANPLVTELVKAPFEATVLDADTGLYTIAPVPDLADKREQIIPSRIFNLPVTDPSKVNYLGATFTWDKARACSTHRMTTILSAVPAGTNDARCLWTLKVDPKDALKRLGVGAIACRGPVKEIHLRTVHARIPWVDSDSDAILGSFGAGTEGQISTLTPVNRSEIVELGEGTIAAELAALLDHYEGSQAVALNPAIVPVGSVHTVTHTIDGAGSYLTMINADARPTALSADHFLSDAARRTLLREVQ